jgi:glycosyltransferase 2 family protein
MRRLLLALVLLLAVYLAISRFTEVQQVAETLQRGNGWWLALGFGLQLAWLVNNALILRAVYRLLGLEAHLGHLLPLVISNTFVNIAAPTGGMGGMALLISDARRRGLSPARVTIAGGLFVLFEYFSVLCVVAAGVVVLIRRNDLTAVEVGAAAILLIAALALSGLLVLGISSPPRFERTLLGLARIVNRGLWPILRRPYLSELRAHEFAQEACEGLEALRTNWSAYVPAALLALFSKVLLIALLMVIFLAFDEPFSAGTLVAGFSIGHLFTLVSPTPSGLGVVEGAMTLALGTQGVSLGAATVITLAFRGFTFWLPFLYGFFGLRVLHHQWDHQKAGTPA